MVSDGEVCVCVTRRGLSVSGSAAAGSTSAGTAEGVALGLAFVEGYGPGAWGLAGAASAGVLLDGPGACAGGACSLGDLPGLRFLSAAAARIRESDFFFFFGPDQRCAGVPCPSYGT